MRASLAVAKSCFVRLLNRAKSGSCSFATRAIIGGTVFHKYAGAARHLTRNRENGRGSVMTELDLFLPGNVWGDDFGPHSRRRSIGEKLARGVNPSDGDHLDEMFDMEAELRELSLQVSNTRLLLARKAITEDAALVIYKDAKETTGRQMRRIRDLLGVPVEEDVSYRLENASGKVKSTLTELEEESNHLLRLLRAAGIDIALEAEEPRRRKNPVAKKRMDQKNASGSVAAAGARSSPDKSASGGGGGAGDDDLALGIGGAAAAAGLADGEAVFDRELTMQGFLLKKKKDKGGQKKRWIVCNATHMIYYDKRDGKELGRLPLKGCKAVSKKDDDGSHMMLDCPEDSYVFSFIPSTEEQPTIDMWCEFIMQRSGGGDSAAAPQAAESEAGSESPAPASTPSGGAGNAKEAAPVSATPENESIEMFFAGYLLKRKEKNGKFSAPKRRYCLLDGASLKYLERKGGTELGSMLLSDMKVSLVSTEDGDCMHMKIAGESYSFSADQAPHISEWVKKLLEQGAGKGEVAALSDGVDGMSAFLNKKKDKGNGKFTSAKKRWCVCDGKCLTYYEKKGAPELGSLSLSGCQVSLRNDDDGSWVMILKTDEAQHLFGNIDGSTMQPWVDFILRKTQKDAPQSASAPLPSLPARRERATVIQPKSAASTSAPSVTGGAAAAVAAGGEESGATARRRRVGLTDSTDGSGRTSANAGGDANGPAPSTPSPAASPRTDRPAPAARTSPRQPRPAGPPPAAQAPNPASAGRGTSRQTLRERRDAAPAPAAAAVVAPMEDEFGI